MNPKEFGLWLFMLTVVMIFGALTSAYIVRQAGGCANHLDGSVFDGFENFDPQRTADMLVSSSPAVQKRLLELINDSG